MRIVAARGKLRDSRRTFVCPDVRERIDCEEEGGYG